MRILLTKGTPNAPKSGSQFIHIHKSLRKKRLCSLEPSRGTQKEPGKKKEAGERSDQS